ncbi:MAG: restriction endonuclease [Pirellulales bacterium]|nr:restriction endonuclease [Pirellulales bacterium]
MSAPNPFDQLRKLAALRDEGVIDSVEFDRLKAQLLAQVGGVANAASLVENHVQTLLDASVAVDAALAPPGDRVAITSSQVDESQLRLTALQRQVEHLAGVHQDLLARAASTHRRVRHDAFLLRARQSFRNFALGRIAPALVAAGVGMVVGCVLVGMFPFPTRVVLAGGFLTAGAALLAMLHLLVHPRDQFVQERLTTDQPKLAQLRSQIADNEPTVAAAQKAFDAAKHHHAELVRQFNSRRNELLSFDWRDLRGVSFEKFVRAIFDDLGYRARAAKLDSDQGVDFVAEKGDESVAVQVKGCAEMVENSSIQKVHTGMSRHRCVRCAVITNSTFTPSAIELAARTGCVLVDRSRIHLLIQGKIQL